MWRNYWLSFSFANIVFLRAWSDLLPISGEFLFLRRTLPGLSLYFAIASDVLALSQVTFLLVCLAPKMPQWLQRALPVAAIAMAALAPAGFLHADVFHFLPAKAFLPLAALFGVVLIGLAFGFPAQTLRLVRIAALTATPCIAVTFVEPLFFLRAQTPLPPDPPLARRLPGTPPVRVLWIVFDEWDQEETFTHRAPGTPLPVLDALADRSFTATHALAVQSGIPIGGMSTSVAIPSLLYGKHVGDSAAFGADDSIFARMRSHGWNAAAAGWYLPYCRSFDAQLVDCYWDIRYEPRSSASPALAQATVDEARMLFETSMFSPFRRSLVMVRHFSEYRALLAAARRYAADPSLGLGFIHFNVPHGPRFSPTDRYSDALRGVDRAVGDILSTVNRAGLDSKTAIILSSDHPDRFYAGDYARAPYVPFMVHLPGDAAVLASDEEFSTIRTADLVLAIAAGRVKSTSDIEHLLGIRHVAR